MKQVNQILRNNVTWLTYFVLEFIISTIKKNPTNNQINKNLTEEGQDNA